MDCTTTKDDGSNSGARTSSTHTPERLFKSDLKLSDGCDSLEHELGKSEMTFALAFVLKDERNQPFCPAHILGVFLAKFLL